MPDADPALIVALDTFAIELNLPEERQVAVFGLHGTHRWFGAYPWGTTSTTRVRGTPARLPLRWPRAPVASSHVDPSPVANRCRAPSAAPFAPPPRVCPLAGTADATNLDEARRNAGRRQVGEIQPFLAIVAVVTRERVSLVELDRRLRQVPTGDDPASATRRLLELIQEQAPVERWAASYPF